MEPTRKNNAPTAGAGEVSNPEVLTANSLAAKEALAKLHGADEKVEFRCIKPGGKSVSTYDLEEALEYNRQGRNIFHTLNPILPEFKGYAASDEDITRLRWIPYDLDPKRATNTSSTDAEKAEALAVAKNIVAFWREREYRPIVIDSGNGYWVLVPCDLPTECSVQISTLLAEHNKLFGTGAVKIDPTVTNPSRVSALPVTIKRKGESTHERPWRMVKLALAGNRDKALDEASLRAMLPEKPEVPQPIATGLTITWRQRGLDGAVPRTQWHPAWRTLQQGRCLDVEARCGRRLLPQQGQPHLKKPERGASRLCDERWRRWLQVPTPWNLRPHHLERVPRLDRKGQAKAEPMEAAILRRDGGEALWLALAGILMRRQDRHVQR
jgi:hypothetical protein